MPDANSGFVLIYRSILENPAFRNAEEAMFFAFLVLKANWKPGERRYDDRVYRLDRGELVIGLRKLAEDFGWSHKKVRTLMKHLIDASMIVQKWAQHGAHRAPVTTICNYEKFQVPVSEQAQGEAQQGHSRGTPKKERKEGKEENHTVASLAAEQFEVFWRTYPSRGDHPNPKKAALAKFEAALKRGVAAADIIRGAANYAAYVARDGTDPRFVAQAQTWLSPRQERWMQYQEAAGNDAPTPIML